MLMKHTLIVDFEALEVEGTVAVLQVRRLPSCDHNLSVCFNISKCETTEYLYRDFGTISSWVWGDANANAGINS